MKRVSKIGQKMVRGAGGIARWGSFGKFMTILGSSISDGLTVAQLFDGWVLSPLYPWEKC